MGSHILKFIAIVLLLTLIGCNSKVQKSKAIPADKQNINATETETTPPATQPADDYTDMESEDSEDEDMSEPAESEDESDIEGESSEEEDAEEEDDIEEEQNDFSEYACKREYELISG